MFLLLASLVLTPYRLDAESADQELPVSTEEEISLNMPDIELADALRLLAKLTHINLVVDENVTGVVNLYLQDVTPHEAWNALLKTKGLEYRREGNLLYVFVPEAIPSKAEATETKIIQLKYITLGSTMLSRNMGGQLTGAGGGFQGSQRGRMTASPYGYTGERTGQETEDQEQQLDEILKEAFGEEELMAAKDIRTNRIILTGAPHVVEKASQIIDILDQPVAQLLITAKFIQVRTEVLRDLGIDWGGIYTFNNTGDFNFIRTRERNEPGNFVIESNRESQNFTSQLRNFNVTLSALIEGGDARVLSSPRVVTQNNKEAFIASGQEIQIPSGLDINGNTTFRERQVALELGVTPRVLVDALISLSIRIRNDTVNFAQPEISGVPPLDINTVESFVTLRDSDTVVIGGIFSAQDNNQKTRIPLLSDIPLLGGAFRKNRKSVEQSELIILITPKIISNEEGFLFFEPNSAAIPNKEQEKVIEEMAQSEILWKNSATESESEKNKEEKKNMRSLLNKKW